MKGQIPHGCSLKNKLDNIKVSLLLFPFINVNFSIFDCSNRNVLTTTGNEKIKKWQQCYVETVSSMRQLCACILLCIINALSTENHPPTPTTTKQQLVK
jgi:hypothetical protein